MMFTATLAFILLVAHLQTALTSPLFLSNFLIRDSGSTSSQTPTPLTTASVDSEFLRPAEFSRVAYCPSATVTSWNCGEPCASLGGNVEVLQVGGDDGLVPMYFIAHDPATQSIVVAHQGTDPSNILSILNDVQIPLVGLNSSRFPNIDASVHVNDGFQKTFERTADSVLAGVQNGLSTKGVNNVLVTGHSLGAAVAMMDAMMLKATLDPSVQITTTVFGLPRVGNAAWADLIDATLGNTITHMTNQHDPVPSLPPRLFKYQQPSQEVHINAVNSNGEPTNVVACPGQENEHCSEGNSIFDASIANHLGPYLGNVSFGSEFCSS